MYTYDYVHPDGVLKPLQNPKQNTGAASEQAVRWRWAREADLRKHLRQAGWRIVTTSNVLPFKHKSQKVQDKMTKIYCAFLI